MRDVPTTPCWPKQFDPLPVDPPTTFLAPTLTLPAHSKPQTRSEAARPHHNDHAQPAAHARRANRPKARFRDVLHTSRKALRCESVSAFQFLSHRQHTSASTAGTLKHQRMKTRFLSCAFVIPTRLLALEHRPVVTASALPPTDQRPACGAPNYVGPTVRRPYAADDAPSGPCPPSQSPTVPACPVQARECR